MIGFKRGCEDIARLRAKDGRGSRIRSQARAALTPDAGLHHPRALQHLWDDQIFFFRVLVVAAAADDHARDAVAAEDVAIGAGREPSRVRTFPTQLPAAADCWALLRTNRVGRV